MDKGTKGKAPVKGKPIAAEADKSKSEPAPVLEFKVYRENPSDPFKPTSETAVKALSTQPRKEILEPDDEQLLQSVAADLDRSLSVEEIVTLPYPDPKINFECSVELAKLPTWLRSMIRARFSLIQDHFKHDTAKIIRNLATKINQRKLLKSDYGGFDFGKEAKEFETGDEELLEKEPSFFEASGAKTVLRAVHAGSFYFISIK